MTVTGRAGGGRIEEATPTVAEDDDGYGVEAEVSTTEVARVVAGTAGRAGL